MENELDERKRKILKAIIQTYLETGEPVGSRTISKYTDLNLSSATIRNEMSDLEELGYIIQPYTSAGRIPSDLGYRLYVDELMKEKDKEVAEIKDLMIEKTDKMEKVLKQVVKILASNTNYATMITGPTYHRNKLKFIQLSRVTEPQLLAVVVVLAGLAGAMYYQQDKAVGTFARVPENRGFLLEMGSQLLILANVLGASQVALVLTGDTRGFWPEAGAFVVFLFACLGFSMLLGTLLPRRNAMAVALPVIAVAMLAVCPVFFDLGFLRRFQLLFPPTYFLRGLYQPQ